MHPVAPSRLASRSWWLVGIAIAAVVAVGVVSAGFVVKGNSGNAGGEQNPTGFLTHFQQTGVFSTVTPNPIPAVLSTVVTLPTRLPAASTAYLLDAGVAGDEAAEWTFSESPGILLNQEMEISFTVQDEVGAATHTFTTAVFVESQAVALGAALTFDVYWDAAAAAGVTLVSETQIGQGCSAVGTCP
jgi:hypothetical protein